MLSIGDAYTEVDSKVDRAINTTYPQKTSSKVGGKRVETSDFGLSSKIYQACLTVLFSTICFGTDKTGLLKR